MEDKMNEQSREDIRSRPQQPLSPLMMVEALRTAVQSPPAGDEGRIPLYWRIFGGTILSLVGMVVLTVFQQLHSTLGDFSSELNQSKWPAKTLSSGTSLAARCRRLGTTSRSFNR